MTKQVEAMHALRQLSSSELAEHLRERRRKLFEIRFQQATGQVENHRQIRDLRQEMFNLRLQQASAQLEKPARLHTLRRDIARIETRVSQLRKKAA